MILVIVKIDTHIFQILSITTTATTKDSAQESRYGNNEERMFLTAQKTT